MAYFLTYTCTVNNRRSNAIKLDIYRKDVDPGDVTTLLNTELTGIKVSCPQSDESKYPTIIGTQAEIGLRVRTSSVITPETFLTDYYDEWKVIIYCDDAIVFAGFVDPTYSPYTMKDAPLGIALRCTDGLGLLKNIPLTAQSGASFQNTVQTLIDYVAGALAKTNLDLNIRVYCSIYESSMNDRGVSALYDMFSQAKLDYRTFMNSATDFVDCYEALNIILTGGFSLFQWQGKWIISYRPEMQGTIGPTNYYTEYDPSGSALSGNQDLTTHINIGFNQQQHPIELDQIIDYQVPQVSVKDIFNFTVWDEVPKNNKFERGSLIFPLSGPGYSAFSIDDWEYVTRTGGFSTYPFGTTPSLQVAYSKRLYNDYGVEIDRQIICDRAVDGSINWLRSDAIPVNKGDKIIFSCDKRFDNNVDAITSVAHIYIVAEDNINYYGWLYDFTAGDTDNKWILNSLVDSGIKVEYDDGESLDADGNTQFHSVSAASPAIPIDGTMYIVLAIPGEESLGSSQYYKNINFEYIPFIVGSYIRIKGDYWRTYQNQNIKNRIEEEVKISDSLKKILKGALLRNDGATLTTPTWYRFGRSEEKHFKELLNLGKYCHYYRRYRKITGTFRGVKCYSENTPTSFYPLCFHKHFKFVDNSPNKLYALCPPLSVDYISGRFSGTFIECFDTSGAIGTVPETYTDSEQAGDGHEFKYIF